MENQVEIAEPNPGEFRWIVKDSDTRILGQSPLYESREATLSSLFRVFLGVYDESEFGNLYSEYQANELAAKRAGKR